MFPQLHPLPRRFPLVLVALAISAWLLLLPANALPGSFPGDTAQTFGPVTLNLHWQVQTRGLEGYVADAVHGLPYHTDRSVVDGLPLDAILSWPLTLAFGFAGGMWAWAWFLAFALGASGAWLGGRWWGTASGALIGGAGWQVSEVVLREIADGRSTQALAAVGLPLCLGLGVAGRPVAAGVAAALTTLASWDFALYALPLALGPALARRDFTTALTTIAAWSVPVLPMVGWVWSGIFELPSSGAGSWSPVRIAGSLARPADLAATRIYGGDGILARTLTRPVLLACVVWTTRRAGVSWWLVAVAAGGATLGLGFWLPGPVIAPWGWMSLIPGFSRLWWPDRAWLLPALALAVMAGGARWMLAPALLAEAFLFSPALPYGAIPLRTVDTALRLAEAPGVPLLLLPLGEGRFRADRLDLIEQITHGRPMANGTRSPFDVTAPAALARGWRENVGLRAVAECEMGRALAPLADHHAQEGMTPTESLLHAGIKEVWLDTRYLGESEQGRGYRTCLETALQDWSREEIAPFVRYRE